MKNHYVYWITNTVTLTHYIGVRSCDCEPILDKYWSSSKYVKSDIDVYGISCFKKYILGVFPCREQAVAEEIRLHNKFAVDINESFYNKAKQTSKKFDTSSLIGEKNHFFGKSHSEATKHKLREKNVGKIGHWRNHEIPAETKEKLRQINLGKKYSDETKEKHRIAIVGKRVGENHPMFGKNHKPESKEKTSNALRGIPKSQEMREKLKQTQKERPCGFSGKKHSIETKLKIASASKEMHSKRKQRIVTTQHDQTDKI